MFPLAHRKLIRGCQAHKDAGLGCGADYEADYVPLYAPFDGKILTFGGPSDQGGYWIRLTRKDSVRFEFAHLSQYMTSTGKQVKEGQQIGVTGNTGTITTGPHLHTQIFVNNRRVDPEQFDWNTMLTFKLKLIVNNLNWTTLGSQIDWLKQRILEKSNNRLQLDVSLEHTSFANILYEDYAPNIRGIQRAWFKQNVLPKATGFHGVILLINQADWQGSQGIEGYAYLDDSRPQEMQVTASENNTVGYPNTEPLSNFVAFAEHELYHTCFQVTGEPDITHDYISQGKFNEIASVINYSKLSNYLKGPTMNPNVIIYKNGSEYQLTFRATSPQGFAQQLLDAGCPSLLNPDGSPNFAEIDKIAHVL